MSDDTLRIVLADDHRIVRAGIRMLLEAVPGWTVVAECADADAAAREVRAQHPDVLVLDLMMPGRASMDVLAELHADQPRVPVVVLTMAEDPASARAAMEAGCDGYVLKEASDDELVEAIRRVVGGGSYLDPTIGALVASDHAPPTSRRLSGRERDVLQRIATGHTNTEIADALDLSVRTVETHRARIQEKTGCKTRAELVAHAIDAGLLDAMVRAHHRPTLHTPNEV
jgi:two-component system response regulator NreC